MPKDASVNGDGFRFYSWPGGDTPLHHLYGATEATDVLSVTSIRSLAGEPFQLVAWKIANVVNLAMGVRKQTRIGPRGGVNEVYVKDGDFPGEFVTRMVESRGAETKLDLVRKWLRDSSEEPRDIAAVRGSVVHKMIEQGVPLGKCDEVAIRARFEAQWKEERRKVKPDVTDEDISFAMNAMRQYWDMRAQVPFVILAQEPQVWNVEAGYAGSLDALVWFLGGWDADGTFVPLPGVDVAAWQSDADRGRVTIDTIAAVGGTLAVGDWKTSKGVYSGHVTQITAYMGAGFVGAGGVIDDRLTKLLLAASLGVVIHIRPNKWAVEFFPMREDVIHAFLGSVTFARFLALHKTPTALFTRSLSGVAPGTDESKVADESE